MRKQFKHRRWWLALGFILVVLVVAGAALAATGAASVDWWVIAGGGRQSSAATSLSGTVGQWASGSSNTRLCAGFWCGVAVQYKVFLPLVLRSA